MESNSMQRICTSIPRIRQKNDGTNITEGTNTCHWCKKSQMSHNKQATYARIVVNVRPEKDDPNRVRITAGGNRLNCYEETPTEITSLEKVKILINSVLSTKKCKIYGN